MYTVRFAMYNAQCSYLYTNETTDYDKEICIWRFILMLGYTNNNKVKQITTKLYNTYYIKINVQS